jgi:hypothetical protein
MFSIKFGTVISWLSAVSWAPGPWTSSYNVPLIMHVYGDSRLDLVQILLLGGVSEPHRNTKIPLMREPPLRKTWEYSNITQPLS